MSVVLLNLYVESGNEDDLVKNEAVRQKRLFQFSHFELFIYM